MTEEEAKTKWCPMVRFTNTPDGISGRILSILWTNRAKKTGEVACIASDCMWWVWDEWEHYSDDGSYNPDGTPIKGHCGAIK